jgi:hypothetical protein
MVWDEATWAREVFCVMHRYGGDAAVQRRDYCVDCNGARQPGNERDACRTCSGYVCDDCSLLCIVCGKRLCQTCPVDCEMSGCNQVACGRHVKVSAGKQRVCAICYGTTENSAGH